jgi:hypothetical protein
MEYEGIQDSYPHLEDKPVLDLINMNLIDQNSRYLMIISKPEIAAFLMERQFKNLF